MALRLDYALYDEFSLAFCTHVLHRFHIGCLLHLLDLVKFFLDLTLLIGIGITTSGNLDEFLLLPHCLLLDSLFPLFLYVVRCFFRMLPLFVQLLLVYLLFLRIFLLFLAESLKLLQLLLIWVQSFFFKLLSLFMNCGNFLMQIMRDFFSFLDFV